MTEWRWKNCGIRRMWAIEKVFGGWMWFWKWCRNCFRENLKLRSYSCYALCKQVCSAIAVVVQVEFRICPYVSKRPSGSPESNLHGSIVNVKKISKISTCLLPWNGWFCPVVSDPVKPYFIRFLRALSFCLGVSKSVNFCANGVVNGVVE